MVAVRETTLRAHESGRIPFSKKGAETPLTAPSGRGPERTSAYLHPSTIFKDISSLTDNHPMLIYSSVALYIFWRM